MIENFYLLYVIVSLISKIDAIRCCSGGRQCRFGLDEVKAENSASKQWLQCGAGWSKLLLGFEEANIIIASDKNNIFQYVWFTALAFR